MTKRELLRLTVDADWFSSVNRSINGLKHALAPEGHLFKTNQTFKVIAREPRCRCCGVAAHSITFQDLGTRNHENQVVWHLHYIWTADNRKMTKDHITPRHSGGSDSMTNYQTLCSRCNVFKGAVDGEPVFCQGFYHFAVKHGHYNALQGSGCHIPISQDYVRQKEGQWISHSMGFVRNPSHPHYTTGRQRLSAVSEDRDLQSILDSESSSLVRALRRTWTFAAQQKSKGIPQSLLSHVKQSLASVHG